MEANDGLFSFRGSTLTGWRQILLFENKKKVNFGKDGTFNIFGFS